MRFPGMPMEVGLGIDYMETRPKSVYHLFPICPHNLPVSSE